MTDIDRRCYAEREPVEYFTRLKELHRQLRQAFARDERNRAERLKSEIRTYRLLSHMTYGYRR